jgi:hypothetical protein
MLARCSTTSAAGIIVRWFGDVNSKNLDDRCLEVFNKVIQPALIRDGAVATFHGTIGNRAVITIKDNIGDTDTVKHEGWFQSALQSIQAQVPEIDEVRPNFIIEDD